MTEGASVSQDAELDGRLAVVLPDGFNPARDDKRIPVRRIYGMYNPARDSIRAGVDQLLGRNPEPVSQDEMHRPSMEKDTSSVPEPVLGSAIAPNPDWHYDGDERVYKWLLNYRDGVFVASDEAGNELQDSGGERIFVDSLGHRVPDPDADGAVDSEGTGEAAEKVPAKRRRFSTGALLNRGRGKTDEIPDLYDQHGVQLVDFDIAKVGKSGVLGSRYRGRKALTLISSALAFVAVTGLIIGVTVGRSAVPAEGAISPSDAAAYRLTTYPTNAATAFAQQYLTMCLTHGDVEAVKKREQLLKAMSTPGTAPGCGWTSGGLQQEPAMITWDGTISPITEFATGEAAYLGFNVSMADGQYQTMSVPVWVKSSKTGNDLRIVGDVGVSAPMRLDNPPPAKPKLTEDAQLVGQVKDPLLAPFFSAWGASNAGQLNLVLADTAGPRPRTGLGEIVSKPQIEKVTVRSPRATNTSSNQSIVYEDGDIAVAEVRVTWNVPGSESTQASGYRVDIVRNSGKWLVTDIRAGLVDREGAASSGSGLGSATDLVPGAASTRGSGDGE